MSDSPKDYQQITIELFNGLCEAIDDVNLRECAERLGHFAVARPTALMEENAKLKKLLEEAYDRLDKLKIQRCPLVN